MALRCTASPWAIVSQRASVLSSLCRVEPWRCVAAGEANVCVDMCVCVCTCVRQCGTRAFFGARVAAYAFSLGVLLCYCIWGRMPSGLRVSVWGL